MSKLAQPRARSVVHARIGREAYEILESFAGHRGCSLTQALKDLLQELRQREIEDTASSRLDSIARSLMALQEQAARHATRIEAVVAVMRSIESGQTEREAQILQNLAGGIGISQLTYAHLLAMIEVSSRASEIATSAQGKIRALRGEA